MNAFDVLEQWRQQLLQMVVIDFATCENEDNSYISAVKVTLPNGTIEWFYKGGEDN